MLCKSPYMKGVMPCGCGQCKPCRINLRRLWSNRIMLESMLHSASAFVTLTYEQKQLPDLGTLVPKDTQDWLKRLRHAVDPQKIRYFLVGEYGDVSMRPHYHVALFGYQPCRRGRTNHVLHDFSKSRFTCCTSCSLLQSTWEFGSIDIGQLEPESIQYIAGYTLKKLTQPDNERNKIWRQKNNQLLGSLHPEFSRMSLNPGIGAKAMKAVAALSSKLKLMESGNPFSIDVPNVLQHCLKKFPLGRYLKRKIREELGRSQETPKEAYAGYLEELQCLFRDAKTIEEKEGTPSCFLDRKSLQSKINHQRLLNEEARCRITDEKRLKI